VQAHGFAGYGEQNPAAAERCSVEAERWRVIERRRGQCKLPAQRTETVAPVRFDSQFARERGVCGLEPPGPYQAWIHPLGMRLGGEHEGGDREQRRGPQGT
jgi:hypothetical protein